MRHFYISILLSGLSMMIVNAQTMTSNNTIQQTNEKPVGLPKVEWDILRMDVPARENLCERQTAYCANNCGGPDGVAKNFCNATSMAWGCTCSGTTGDFPSFLWPVVQAECSGKALDCQMICNKDTVHPSTCAAICNSYYQCGTDKSPTSYLQTTNPTDMPASYDGPPKIDVNNPANNSNNPSTVTSQGHQLGASFTYLLVTLVFIIKLLN